MTRLGLMNILPGILFYVYIANLTTKQGRFPISMISATGSNVPLCIIDERVDDPCPTKSVNHASTQCGSAISIHAIHYKPPERRDELVDKHNPVRDLEGSENLNWCKKFQLSVEYFACLQKFVEMLVRFENMWDGPLKLLKERQHRIQLKKSKDRPIYSDQYSAASRQRKFEIRKIKIMLSMHGIEPA